MIHSHLSKFLHKHNSLQIVLAVLPVLLLSVYVFAYMLDLSNVFWVLTNNDKACMQDMNRSYLYEVTNYTENDSGTFSCTVSGDTSKDIEVKSGNRVYYIQLVDSQTSKFCTDSEVWLLSNDLVYDSITANQDNTYTVQINDKTLTVSSSEDVYEVKINDYDNYTITYSDDTTESVESVPCIKINKKTGDTFDLHVQTSFNKEFDDFTLNYVSVLPNDNVYFNTYTGTFLKNVSNDFSKNFMLGNKLIVVIMSMTALLVLYFICWRKTDYKVLGNGWVFKINLLLIYGTLGLLVVITLSVI